MVRSMPGHGLRTIRSPPWLAPTLLPSRVTTSAAIPGSGNVADPGFAAVAPGIGLIMIPPVSVCHQVSTIGHRWPPIALRYHIHAAGLIGSPTEPSSRRLDRSCFFTQESPHFINVRIAVGAV